MCWSGKRVPGPFQGLSSREDAEDLGRGPLLDTNWAGVVTASPCYWLGTQENAFGAKGKKKRKANEHTSPLGLLESGSSLARACPGIGLPILLCGKDCLPEQVVKPFLRIGCVPSLVQGAVDPNVSLTSSCSWLLFNSGIK